MLSALMVSCDTDGGDSKIDLAVGATPDITPNVEYATILNLLDLEAGKDITFGFSVDVAQGNVASADVVGFYKTATGEVYGPVTLKAGVTEFPIELTMTTSDIVNAFEELNSLSDFKLADQLIITAKLYLEDGRELDIYDVDGRLYGSDIHTSSLFNAIATYPVGCPLNGTFSGDYQVTITGSGGFGLFAESGVYTLKETSQTQRSFAINHLPEAGPFGQTVVLEFVCGIVSIPAVATGVGCGAGEITFGSTDEGVSIDPEDDSSFTITINDMITDGGCGVGAYEVILAFEKI